jgi:hypothetical protein
MAVFRLGFDGAPKKFQQDLHTLARRNDASDHRFEPLERSFDDLNGLPRGDRLIDLSDFAFPAALSELLQYFVRQQGDSIPEVEHRGHPLRRANSQVRLHIIEARKQITGKHGFDKPYGAPRRGFFEAQPWAEDVDSFHLPQGGCRDMLALWLRAQAEPGGHRRIFDEFVYGQQHGVKAYCLRPTRNPLKRRLAEVVLAGQARSVE